MFASTVKSRCNASRSCGPIDRFRAGVQAITTHVGGKRLGKNRQTGRVGAAITHADQHRSEPLTERVAKRRPLDQNSNDPTHSDSSPRALSQRSIKNVSGREARAPV